MSDTDNVYVGREVSGVVQGSSWGNPFTLSDYSRQTAVACYETYINLDKELADSARKLKGKKLGCWCSPYKCHAEILHKLAGNQPVYQKLTRGSKCKGTSVNMVTKKELEDSLGTLKTELASQLKTEIKAAVDESINALQENVINRLLQDNKLLKEKVASLERNVRSLTIAVADSLQYSRLNNIVISGIPKEIEQKNLLSVSINIINHCLTEGEVTQGSFEACHRISKKSSDVVCRLVNRRAVEDTLRNWKKLTKYDPTKLGLPTPAPKLFVNSHLSPYRATIAYYCRKLKRANRIEKLSTHKGNIKILMNAENEEEGEADRWKLITHLDQLKEMFDIDVDELDQ